MSNILVTRRNDALSTHRTPKNFALALGSATFQCRIIGPPEYILAVEQQLTRLASQSHYARLLLEELGRLPGKIDIYSHLSGAATINPSDHYDIIVEHNACVGNKLITRQCLNGTVKIAEGSEPKFEYPGNPTSITDNHMPSIIILAHELFHAGWYQNRNFYQRFEPYYRARSVQDKQLDALYFPKDNVDESEILATKYTNLIRIDLNIGRIRAYYHHSDKQPLDSLKNATSRHGAP